MMQLTNNFPISFKTFVSMGAAGEYSYDGRDSFITSITIESFDVTYQTDIFPRSWIAIGV